MISTPLIVADTVFVSATVELSVPVAMPLPFVVLAGCVSVLPVPVAERATVAPLMAFPFPSRAVTVIVDVPLPAVIEVGDAVTLDCDADTGPGVTVTAAVWLISTPLIVADTVLDPATVELRLPAATPLPFVVLAGCVSVLPPPVAVRLTLAPLIRFPLASRAVTVMVDAPLPAVIEVGDAVTVDCEADTGPGVTVTLAVGVIATPPAVAEIVFPPVLVELNVAVNTPLVFVVPVAGLSVFPVPPVAVRLTLAPLIRLPLASRAVTVTVELPLPAVIDVGAAVTVDCEAETTAVQVIEKGAVTVPPAGTETVWELPPLTVQLAATPEIATVWLLADRPG